MACAGDREAVGDIELRDIGAAARAIEHCAKTIASADPDDHICHVTGGGGDSGWEDGGVGHSHGSPKRQEPDIPGSGCLAVVESQFVRNAR
jgi:hypothetical protein